MAFWVLAAHPDNYRVLDAVLELDEELWRTGGRPLAAGDRVAIYKYRGRDAVRGVIALGEVLTDPEVMDISDDGNPYALPGSPRGRPAALAPRVRVRYGRPPGVPRWLGEHPRSVVDELSVTRAQGGTAFRVTDEQWERLLEEVGGWPADDGDGGVEAAVNDLVRGRAGGQGFGLTAAARRAVERRAMDVAGDHFRGGGWKVTDVSASSPFDLLCRRGAEERRVEVKGTTGVAAAVLLMRNEVISARAAPALSALAVVDGIELEPGDPPVARGGTLRLLDAWAPADADLTPLAYRCPLPPPASS